MANLSVPPNNLISTCMVTSVPGYRSFPKWAIDGIPFSPEGYERAKNILKANYGNTSEIFNAYVENILALPTISGTNAVKIHDFYQKLLYTVQSLETLGKMSECLALVQGVLNTGSARVFVYLVFRGVLNRVYGILQLKYGYSVYHFL